MLTGLPDCATARMKSVCRLRKAGVCSTSTTRPPRHLVLAVHVGQHRHLQLALDLGQDLQALVHAGAAERRCRWSGWPCRSSLLKMNGMPSAAVISFRLPGDVHLQLLGLDDAGAGDQEEAAWSARRRSHRASSATAFTAPLLPAPLRAAWCSQRRLDEADEQRVPVPGRGL